MAQSDDEERREIARAAANYAEANTYLLDNPYLDRDEKLEVEMWYQLPGGVMIHTFYIACILSILYGLAWTYVIGIPVGVNAGIAIINWFFYKKRLVYALYVSVLHSWVLYLAGFATAAFLLLKGSYLLAAIALLAPLGIFAFAEPHLYLYSLLSVKYRMNAKYAFFKREYGHVFPFEQ